MRKDKHVKGEGWRLFSKTFTCCCLYPGTVPSSVPSGEEQQLNRGELLGGIAPISRVKAAACSLLPFPSENPPTTTPTKPWLFLKFDLKEKSCSEMSNSAVLEVQTFQHEHVWGDSLYHLVQNNSLPKSCRKPHVYFLKDFLLWK